MDLLGEREGGKEGKEGMKGKGGCERWGRGDTQSNEPGRNRGAIKGKKGWMGGSVVAVVPAGGEGDVFNTFMLVGDAIPTLRLCYHGLSVQEAKAIQVAH